MGGWRRPFLASLYLKEKLNNNSETTIGSKNIAKHGHRIKADHPASIKNQVDEIVANGDNGPQPLPGLKIEALSNDVLEKIYPDGTVHSNVRYDGNKGFDNVVFTNTDGDTIRIEKTVQNTDKSIKIIASHFLMREFEKELSFTEQGDIQNVGNRNYYYKYDNKGRWKLLNRDGYLIRREIY